MQVKMFSGDYINIARTTADLTNLGSNILTSRDLAVTSTQTLAARNDRIRQAGSLLVQ